MVGSAPHCNCRFRRCFAQLELILIKFRTRASFSHDQLSVFEGNLARKLGLHIFNFQVLRDISHESVAFTSATCSCLRGVLHESFVFHIFNYQFLREVSHEMHFCEIADARNAGLLQ